MSKKNAVVKKTDEKYLVTVVPPSEEMDLGKKINFRLLPRGTNYTEFYIVVVSTVLIILLGLFKTDWLLYAVLVIAAMLVALIVYRRFFKK